MSHIAPQPTTPTPAPKKPAARSNLLWIGGAAVGFAAVMYFILGAGANQRAALDWLGNFGLGLVVAFVALVLLVVLIVKIVQQTKGSRR